MPSKKREKKVVDNTDIAPVVRPQQIMNDEKVEVLIKEIIRIKPRDFEAFKHALEDFVNDWDK